MFYDSDEYSGQGDYLDYLSHRQITEQERLEHLSITELIEEAKKVEKIIILFHQ